MILKLFLYLVCAGLVVVGSLGFIAALSIPGRFRSALACLVSCVPIGIGGWLFVSSGLKLRDIQQLSQGATQEIQRVFQGVKEAGTMRKEINDLMNTGTQ